MQKGVVNLQTGEMEVVDLTPEEIAGLPQPVAPGVPQVVSRFQAFAALHLAGLLEAVEVTMANPATDTLARLAWENALEFRRDSPTVTAIAGLLDLTEEQLDDLFTTAAGITA
ncbi:MAG: hypothetical protein KIT73_02500 [Burkholderiales bacterium]|nr:hypothetical protein [Burkholderiales bacterium]